MALSVSHIVVDEYFTAFLQCIEIFGHSLTPSFLNSDDAFWLVLQMTSSSYSTTSKDILTVLIFLINSISINPHTDTKTVLPKLEPKSAY